MRKRKYDDVESGGAADNQVAICDQAGLSQGVLPLSPGW